MRIRFAEIDGNSRGYWALLFGLVGIIVLALGSAYYMEHYGHVVTGMTNQIVWGVPHVFALFLIVSASGALNIASISSVFNKTAYKPLSRLSALLALALLAGGLMVLVLDLGRADRLIIAMTYYNFKSIFAWNIILYNGFFVIVGVYLWMMMEKRMNKYAKPAGIAAFIWRLVLTTGTGSIFGFLVARQAFDAAILAPMFIVMSFSYGLAIFNLVMFCSYRFTGRELGDAIVIRLRKLLVIFAAAVLYFVIVFHLTNLYATEHHGVERFILLGDNGGSLYSTLFWVGQILIGGVIPLVLLLLPSTGANKTIIGIASILIIIGGITQMYVTLIGAQAYPQILFPGMEVSSSFYDGVVASYSPSGWEIMLGIGGIAVSLAAVVFAIKILPFLPESLADSVVDPHYKKDAKS